MVPSKPSSQTVLVIDKMGEIAVTMEALLKEIQSAIYLLHGWLAIIDTTQQSLVAQLVLISDAVKDGAVKHVEVARYFTSLDERLNASTKVMEQLRVRLPEEDDPDPEAAGGAVHGKGTLWPAQVTWIGNSPGASFASQTAGAHVTDDFIAPCPSMNGTHEGGIGFQVAAGCGVGRVAIFSEALAVVVLEALVAVEPIQCLIRRQNII
jgi:hypothetical protein